MTILAPPTQPLPEPPAAVEVSPMRDDVVTGKRQRFTLTRARSVDAAITAIGLRAAGALAELEAVGIVTGSETPEVSQVRQQLAVIASGLAQVASHVDDSGARSRQIVELLEAL